MIVRFSNSIRFMTVFLGIMWIMFFIQMVTGWTAGIIPRQLSGIAGIALSPFFHAGLYHIISNSIPLFILGLLTGLRNGKLDISMATILLILMSGTILWMFGRDAEHIGASGLIFAYFGFLVASWYYGKMSIINTFIAGATVFLYWYIIPSIFFDAMYSSRISWDGHLAGLIAGIIVGKIEQQAQGVKHEFSS